MFERLIERNATIPTKNSKIFTTVVDNQSAVEIHVLQGERMMASDNKSLGRFELVGIPAAPRGLPQIEVTFAIDSNGIVNVSARDQATGKAQGIQITPAGGLSGAEVERLIAEAEANEARDQARRQVRVTRTRLEGVVTANEKVFNEFGRLLPAGERERVQDVLRRGREACRTENEDRLQRALAEMHEISKLLTHVMLRREGGREADIAL
jgi:molecular chaperone DnaK